MRSHSINRRPRNNKPVIQAAAEFLESRRMLCSTHLAYLPEAPKWSESIEAESAAAREGGPEAIDIVWTNRGQASDNFGLAFGTSAEAGRNVVDAAIAAWERVITSFNRSDGTNTLQLTISIATDMNGNLIGGFGGAGGPAAAAPADGKPRTGSITINAGTIGGTPNDANGWFFDSTPNDYSEFTGAILNPFSGNPGSNVGGELYAVVAAELTHTLGLISPKAGGTGSNWVGYELIDSGFTQATGQRDNAEGGGSSGFFYVFNGPSVSHAMTSFNSGDGDSDSWGNVIHTAGGTANFTHNAVSYRGTEDDGNAAGGGERTLPSWVTANILKDAYGYTIENPAKFGTMMAILNQTTGRLTVRGIDNSADTIFITSNGAITTVHVDLGTDFPGSGFRPGAGNLDAWVSEFPTGSIQSIVIDAGTGDDVVNLDLPGNVPITVSGGAGGNDLLLIKGSTGYDNVNVDFPIISSTALNVQSFGEFEQLRIDTRTGNADLFLPDLLNAMTGVTVQGDSGNETINLHSLEAGKPAVFFMGSGNDTVNVQTDFGAGLVASPVTINGFDGDDVVNVGPVDFAGTIVTQPITFNGGAAQDTFNLGSNNADSSRATMTFNGEGNFGGLGDRILINDQGAAYTVEYEINPTFVQRVGFGTYNINYSQTSEIVINCGSAGDTVNRRPGVSPIVRANGNGGDDRFTESVVAPISASAFNGGAGNNSITFDGSNEAIGRTWDFLTDRVIYSGAVNYVTTQFTTVSVLGGSGADTFGFQPALFTQAIIADGGAGDDTFNTAGSRIPSLTVRGGTGGFDALRVDDRNLLANLDSADLYPNRYVRYRESQFPGDPGEFYNVYYGGFESITTWRRPAQVIVNVYGTSPDVLPTHSTVMNGDTSDSVVNIFGRDANGNPTLASNLTVNAGGTTASDVLRVHLGGSQPGAYRIYNRFANSTAQVDGLGAGYLSIDNLFDSFTFNGSSGPDTFAFDSYRSGNAVVINGNGGDDTMNLVPGSKDIGAITSFASFGFDGGPGSDAITVTNENSASGYAYFLTNSNISTLRIGGGPQLGFGCPNTEVMNIRGSQLADQYQSFFSDAGQRLEFSGLNGNDSYMFGGLIGTTLQLFRGPIFIDGGGGQDNLQLRDEEISAARTFHIAADSVGAFPGDNLFGPGASLRFANIAGTLSFNGGPGAETVYVQPNATAAITINANNPVSAPGDRLFLALAAAQNASINGTAANGSVTSSNLRTLSYNGFETGPTIDAISPTVIQANINVDGDPFTLGGGGQQSVDVSFSENVSSLISPASLSLQNLTTGQTIPTASIAVTYVSETNTARFTFPGLPNGVLPDGNYQGTVLAGLPDFFGNPLASNVNFAFFFLNGDANRDRTVGIGDFAVLASRFNQSGAFSDGDFNYSGMVEIGDFAILASKFNTSLPAPRLASIARHSIANFSASRVESAELLEELA